MISPRSAVNRQAYAYWQSKCAGRAMPSRADINPAEIKALLPHIVLLGVERGPLDFRYRLIGTRVREYLSEDHTGRWMSQIPHQKSPSEMWSIHARVVAEGKPRIGHTPYVGPKKDFTALEDVIMPLSGDGETVTMLFVSVDFFSSVEDGQREDHRGV